MLPVIGITMGDPAGVGPEIILKALSDPAILEICTPLVLGDPGALILASGGRAEGILHEIATPSEALRTPGRIDIIPISRLEARSIRPAQPTPEAGEAMVRYILEGVDMARAGDLAALVTCPINKALMQAAGYPFEGHTQLIAHQTGTEDFVMMLAGDRLRVSLVTIHCALAEVPSRLDRTGVYRTIAITWRALRNDFGLEHPRVAVAALNPHAGESGLFGLEERDIIAPAIEQARDEGILVEGPFPADTLFHQALSGRFDAVVAMYHDQGLIPLKLIHFSDGVNITLGLPIVRTSVDHGTAYDIAGKGVADASSLRAAVRTAVAMARNRGEPGGLRKNQEK